MPRRPNYYVVVCNDGFITHTNTYPLAQDLIEEHGGGFCKGCMNLDEVTAYKKAASEKMKTKEHATLRAMDSFLTSGGKDFKAKQTLEHLARLGVTD